jgi:hypothetical protein
MSITRAQGVYRSAAVTREGGSAMKRFLTLCVFVGASFGCGDDTRDVDHQSGGSNDATATAPDAGASGDAQVEMDAATDLAVRVENSGGACEQSSDCQGASAACLTSLGTANLRFDLPGGYCTANCTAHAQCAAGGGCPLAEIARDPRFPVDISSTVGVPSVCLDRCNSKDASPCRAGYVCQNLRELVPDAIRMSPVNLLLIGPNFTDTFCIPPVEIDLPRPDGGTGDGGLGVSVMASTSSIDAGT